MKDQFIKIAKDGSMAIKGFNDTVKHEFIDKLINPFIPKFALGDVLQIIIGASILAVPVGFTEETWKLGESLPMFNVYLLLGISVLFIGMFTHFNYHKNGLKRSWPVFVRRVFFTYVLSFAVVAILLTVIQRAPWQLDLMLAFKRTVIVTFPSSMSAVVADTLR